ncbi:MAG: AMP-binding protein [Planctomycetota bacterium]
MSQRPDSVALVCGKQTLSYRELNERADRLACRLREQGVRPNTLVGLCVERSIELIVGMLGILKAGGAYVPLDPSYPAARPAFLRADSQATIVLGSNELRSDILSEFPVARAHAKAVEEAMSGDVSDRLAYVMYTSGSTGEPKGVVVTHRGVVRLVKDTNYVRLTADDRFLQYASPSFDASTLEIWGCLLNGGRLVLPPPGALTLDELGRLVRDHRITVLWLAAGVFHLMVDHHVGDLRGVRQLLAGGDVLSPAHVRRALAALPNTRLINGYGPTENTTFTCCHVMTAADGIGETVPIGRPISNTQVYILDRQMQPVPIGVPGELCAGAMAWRADIIGVRN